MKKGVTLVELMVVVLILGLLTGLALPAMRTLGRWPLKTAAQELAAAMREARETAITHGQTCTLVFYDMGGRYRLDLPEETLWTNLPEGLSMIANLPVVGSRPTLYFRYTGAPNLGGYVRLRDQEGHLLYVIVTPVTGRVRIDSVPP
ncbi:MAG: prepilin-type N-terminal cleavage/methylation domain-containing protein [Firmicutes bacterium]|nr:prepilin-type N-terminal cleavage/methylation domain-containing protein [Bacillota bacterium]